MAVTLAPAALDRVRSYLAQTPQALGLRFGVKRTGCSGWGYLVDLACEQFVFRNPNVQGECGCGESFTTQADRAA